MLQVDAGDLLWGRPTVSAKDDAQRRLKAELILESTTAMGMDALAVGEGDLAFGLQWLVQTAKKYDAPYVSANLRDPDGALVFPATRVVKKGERTIGLTSVTLDTLGVAEGRFDAPEPALRDAVATLEKQGVDVVIALVHTNFDDAQRIAKAVPGVDLMFSGHSRRHQEDALIFGNTALMEAGSRAKYLGEVRIDFREGGTGWADPGGRERILRQKEQFERQLRRYEEQMASATSDSARTRLQRVRDFTKNKLDELVVPPEDDGNGNRLRGRRVPLSRDIPDDPAIARMVDGYLQRMGPEASTASHGSEHVDVSKVERRQEYGDYVTARACMNCHPAEHKDWMTTGHARAYATLVQEKRHYDNDCWSCHVTGAGKDGGPTGPGDVGPLKNVQCEACHGPGKAHVAKPAKDNIVRAPTEQLCVSCHTEEQTQGRFVFDEYLPKVDHRP